MSLLGMKIVVIGGGIGGLAAARACALRGASVTLLEQADAIREVGAGLQISPNGFAVLRGLGLGDALLRDSVQGQAVSLRDYQKGEVLRLDLTRLDDQSYFFVHRADLVDILARGAREAGVKIRLLQKVKTVHPATLDQSARVCLANGSHMEADLIIGADGLHSVVRPVLNGADKPFFTGQTAWRATVPNTMGRGPEAWLHMAPGRHLVSYPLRDGTLLNLVAIQERTDWSEEGWAHQDDPDNLRRAFADFGSEAQKMLAAVDEVHLWGLFRHPVASVWQQGGCALLGDAAHPTLPFLAQGASMALEDAWALADELAVSEDVPAALTAYQARRQPRATKVINAASGNAWKYHLRFPPLRFAAHTALRLGGRFAPDKMLHQFDWLYAHDETAGPTAVV
jgi:salicylate hydroxylase